MNPRPTALPHYPILPNLAPLSLARPRPWPAQPSAPTTAKTSPARGDQPAVLWRASLAAVTGRFLHVEKWVFLALAALTLPAAAINQSTLWHLLASGALDRAVRAFMSLPGNG